VSRRSPYDDLSAGQWLARTEELLADYPVPQDELVDVVLEGWQSILDSRIGKHKLRIGEHIFPKPQIMGGLLHELIPYHLQSRRPDEWRRDSAATHKDLVYLPDDYWSTEIKTSSHAHQVFGNRSYGQQGTDATKAKKDKSGFYLTVNFEKWSIAKRHLPRVRIIRLGWLDHADMVSQKSPTGQSAKMGSEVYLGKFVVLFKA
jgi:ScaI restriction endonuclease